MYINYSKLVSGCNKTLHIAWPLGLAAIIYCFFITGAVYISQLLNATTTLDNLDMVDNYNIGDEGMAIISEALEHNKSLTKLWVAGCHLSVKGIVCR